MRNASAPAQAPHSLSPPVPVGLALCAGVFLLATSSPLAIAAREAGMGVLAIAFWRMVLSVPLHAPLAMWELRDGKKRPRGEPKTRQAWLFALGAGVFLGAHFACFIGALALTSVASAVTLATLTPLMAAAASRVLEGERAPEMFWPSLAVAMGGVALMTSGEWGGGTRLGNALGLLASATGTGYMMCGRRARASIRLGAYASLVYAVAGAALGLGMLALGEFAAPPSARGWLLCFLLALLPTALGHSVVNWSLRYVPPAFAGLMILGEPPLAMFLCWFAGLGSAPTAAGMAGSALALSGVGVFLGARLRRQRRERAAARRSEAEQS